MGASDGNVDIHLNITEEGVTVEPPLNDNSFQLGGSNGGINDKTVRRSAI